MMAHHEAPPRTRSAAKEQIVHTWSERRKVHHKKPTRPPSVCFLFKQTWDQIWNDPVFGKNRINKTETRQEEEQALNQSQTKLQHRRNNKEQPPQQPRYFPSVLSILQRHAVHQTVETYGTFLNVLPKNYDYQSAIAHAAQSRSRAFFLLDVSEMITKLEGWKHRYNHHPVTFLYDLHHNADPIFLKVLLQSGIVQLATTTQWDLKRATTGSTGDTVVYDSTSLLYKPDGYVREWITTTDRPDGSCCGPLVVDGPDEVRRITHTARRILERRNNHHATIRTPPPPLTFVLVLDRDVAQWHHQVTRTLACCGGGGKKNLVGLSVDASSTASLADVQVNLQALLNDLQLSNLRIDLRNVAVTLENDATKDNNDDDDDFPAEIVTFWTALLQRPDVALITVDATQRLYCHVGALCTRIIGVRESTEEGGGVRRHYYIDDGCYGSLYQKDGLCPLPLFSRQDGASDTNVFSTTIWGQTCDSIDRVAKDLPLPKLQRDDWLVFPKGSSNSEGLGTAFNGFAPPDTAYCVLGYF